jgi:hypothetical protein
MKRADIACAAKGLVSPSFVDLSTGRRIPFHRRNNKLSYMSAEAMAAAFGGDVSYVPARIGFIYGEAEEMPSESVITRNQTWGKLMEELRFSEDSQESKMDMQIVNFSYAPSLGAEKPAPAYGSDSSGSEVVEYTKWTILRNGVDVTSQVEQPVFDADYAIWRVCGVAGETIGISTIDEPEDALFLTWDAVPDQGGAVYTATRSIVEAPDPDDYCNILDTGSNAITFHAVSNSQDLGVVNSTAFQGNGSYVYQAVLLGYHERRYYVIARVSLKDESGVSSSSSGSAYRRKPDGFEVALDWTVVFH